MSKSEDIQGERSDELSRIRRRGERLTPRQRNRVLNALEKALETRDRAFHEGIIRNELGFEPGSELYIRAMNLWDEQFET